MWISNEIDDVIDLFAPISLKLLNKLQAVLLLPHKTMLKYI